MEITITMREALDSGLWEEICKEKGINPWCINEGLANNDDTIELTLEECKKIGFGL